MDTTITGIGAVAVAGLRSAMESTIGQYEKTIRALSGYARRDGTSMLCLNSTHSSSRAANALVNPWPLTAVHLPAPHHGQLTRLSVD